MPLLYEANGPIATFTISNGKVNALTPDMHREMHAALTAFENDRTVKVGILRGAGMRAFCAGDDLKTPLTALPDDEKVMRHFYPHVNPSDEPNYPGWERLVLRLRRFKPIIGAVHGWCLGQGLIYLLHLTDIRIASATARFGLPEIAYGMGGGGGMARIYRHLPRAAAMRMILTGDPIDAAEAYRIHLVNEVVEEDRVAERSLALAERIARHPLVAIRAEMEAFIRSEDLDGDNAFALTDHIYRLQRLALKRDNWEIDFKAESATTPPDRST